MAEQARYGTTVISGNVFTPLLFVLLGALAKIIIFGGTQLSWMVAISSYFLSAVIAWTAFRADKRMNKKETADLSNFTGLFTSVFFPVIELLTVLMFLKRLVSVVLFLRKVRQELSQPSPRRYRSLKKDRVGNIQIGDKVRFHPANSEPIEGIVARFNKKTVRVINNPGEYWNVPNGLLTKISVSKGDSRKARQSLHLVGGVDT